MQQLHQLGVHSFPMPRLGVGSTGTDIAAAMQSPAFQIWSIGNLVSIPVLAYHGYKRNNSVGWALVWGLLGSMVWPVTVPVAIGQGFGKRGKR